MTTRWNVLLLSNDGEIELNEVVTADDADAAAELALLEADPDGAPWEVIEVEQHSS